MKKLTSFLVLIFMSIILFSCQQEDFTNSTLGKPITTEVTSELVKQVALNFSNEANFFRKKSTRNSSSSARIPGFEAKKIDEMIIIPDKNNAPSIFVVTFIPDGYVVISGTKKESPILGYSANGIFDINNVSSGMANWFFSRVKKIHVLKHSDNVEISDEIQNQWAQFAPPQDEEIIVSGGVKREQKGPLLNTTWGQGYGYNTLLDRINGQLPPTGCVATAMAQVMKYHEYPSNYNWSLMPRGSGSLETAQLMKDVGEAVDMDYSLEGSGASMTNARNALVNEFRYSNSVQYVDYNVNTVVSELKNNRPVIMDGYHIHYTDTDGWWIFETMTHHYDQGHAWVCDGYRRLTYLSIHNPGTRYEYTTYTTNGYYLHMNWGWSSTNDGWFRYDNFYISDRYNFQYRNKCIIGVKP